MKQRVRLLALTALAGSGLLVLSPSTWADHSHPFRGSAQLAGRVLACGGAPPPRPCHSVHAHVQATLTSGPHAGAEASGTTTRQGRFAWHLRPGHWTVVADFAGGKEQKNVVLKKDATTRVIFTFHMH